MWPVMAATAALSCGLAVAIFISPVEGSDVEKHPAQFAAGRSDYKLRAIFGTSAGSVGKQIVVFQPPVDVTI